MRIHSPTGLKILVGAHLSANSFQPAGMRSSHTQLGRTLGCSTRVREMYEVVPMLNYRLF